MFKIITIYPIVFVLFISSSYAKASTFAKASADKSEDRSAGRKEGWKMVQVDSFIVKKKKKKPSKSKLQQELGQILDDQLSYFTQTNKKITSCLKRVSQVQEQEQNEIRNYLYNSKDGVLKLQKDTMEGVVKIAKNFQDEMQAFCNQCNTFGKSCKKYFDYLDNSKQSK